ncbi:MAG TPA: hypothetical protein EYO29_02275 [Gammaproteobacteria bacterium]|nr:hypothetical protein [Gammaproteobacteria bacterium]HHZ71619.1 hypothetical protein [Gammaproteobacteria bacterium]HIA41881.1 hypothetical protein [Gammaproteobacteria bacterium]HIB06692.1 hypothetical protein [Gammaproteobacteria bacterium]HIB81325.1 hypothetical protein [Gammaproteobacteria bacterium]
MSSSDSVKARVTVTQTAITKASPLIRNKPGRSFHGQPFSRGREQPLPCLRTAIRNQIATGNSRPTGMVG